MQKILGMCLVGVVHFFYKGRFLDLQKSRNLWINLCCNFYKSLTCLHISTRWIYIQLCHCQNSSLQRVDIQLNYIIFETCKDCINLGLCQFFMVNLRVIMNKNRLIFYHEEQTYTTDYLPNDCGTVIYSHNDE